MYRISGDFVRSDVGTLGGDVSDTVKWVKRDASVIDDADFNPENPGWVDPIPYNGQVAKANVDHIIPRIDTHGCPCGTNSSANALVISAPLNHSMRNSCMDPRRIAILNAWTQAPNPPSP
jgi:hypothetical protein